LFNDAALQIGTADTVTLASTGGVQRNGAAWNAGSNPFTTNDFPLISEHRLD